MNQSASFCRDSWWCHLHPGDWYTTSTNQEKFDIVFGTNQRIWVERPFDKRSSARVTSRSLYTENLWNQLEWCFLPIAIRALCDDILNTEHTQQTCNFRSKNLLCFNFKNIGHLKNLFHILTAFSSELDIRYSFTTSCDTTPRFPEDVSVIRNLTIRPSKSSSFHLIGVASTYSYIQSVPGPVSAFYFRCHLIGLPRWPCRFTQRS